MELNLVALGSQSAAGTVEVSDAVFARELNDALVHQVVTAFQAAARAGTRAQKTRAEVSGGGKKPWRQKGTGRARAGSIRSPIWRTGGTTFAAAPQDFSQKVNRKMYRAAMRSIVSELIRQDRLILVESLSLEAPKTKLLLEKLKALSLKKVLIVPEVLDETLYLAARNIRDVFVCDVNALDPVNLIRFEKCLMTVGALRQLEENLS